MKISAFLTEVESQGIRLSLAGDRIHVEAPEGVLTDDLIQRIKSHKPALVEYLQESQTESITSLLRRAKEQGIRIWLDGRGLVKYAPESQGRPVNPEIIQPIELRSHEIAQRLRLVYECENEVRQLHDKYWREDQLDWRSWSVPCRSRWARNILDILAGAGGHHRIYPDLMRWLQWTADQGMKEAA